MLVFFIIAGAANAVNLTDGLDGLAAGTSIIALFTLTAMAVTIYIRSGAADGNRIETRLDAAFIGAAVIGAAIGFLWFNALPAEVFMGDTGAMALGGAIAAMAIFLKVELLLLLVGGIFVIEALSVMLQVISFKCVGETRVPDGADTPPLRDEAPWSETKIMVRFWIVDRDPLRRRLRALLQVLPADPPGLIGVKALVYYADGALRAGGGGAARRARRRGRAASTGRSGTRTTSRCSTASTSS